MMSRRYMILATLLVLLLTLLIAPWVLAQQEDANQAAPEPTAGSQIVYIVGCGYSFPASDFADAVNGLPVYDNGLVKLPDGTMVPLSAIPEDIKSDVCAAPESFGTPPAQQDVQGFLQYSPTRELAY